MRNRSKKRGPIESRLARLRKRCFARDDYQCAICGKYMADGTLYADERTCSHIIAVGGARHLQFVLENVITMCGKCHWDYEHNSAFRAEWQEKMNIEQLKEEFLRGVGTIVR